jgi:hypothetical protein
MAPTFPGGTMALVKEHAFAQRLRALVTAINENDDVSVEQTVLELSRERKIYAPLAFVVGALVLLFQGLKLVFTNWRLTLVQVLPAMWVWVAMLDLKMHLFRGKSFRTWSGAPALSMVLIIVLITSAAFYLNGVFAFAVAEGRNARIRPAFAEARRHFGMTLGVGAAVGAALGVSAIVVPRWGLGWFSLALGVVIAVMMITYVTIPARLIGAKRQASTRDKVATSVVNGAVGAVVCTPAYVLGRVGILLLGSNFLWILGGIMLSVGLAFQAGASGAVKAIKMSGTLVGARATPRGSSVR